MLLVCEWSEFKQYDIKGVFRTQSNIYDVAYFRKLPLNISRYYASAFWKTDLGFFSIYNTLKCKSSQQRCIKKLLLKISQYSQKNTCIGASFSIELSKACNFIKKRLQHECFPVNHAKYLRTRILKNVCELLLLEMLTTNFQDFFPGM